jgi:hypothetical protein
MTRLLSRILLSIMLFPLAMVLYFILVLMMNGYIDDEYALLWSDVFVAFFVVVYWVGIWRGSVRWTGWRIRLTALAGFASIVVGVTLGIAVSSFLRWGGDEELAIFLSGVLAMLAWLVCTVLLWRETAEERATRVRQAAGDVLFCPKCGYNMTGLYEGRCPECGSRYTLDQLYAAQREGPSGASGGRELQG